MDKMKFKIGQVLLVLFLIICSNSVYGVQGVLLNIEVEEGIMGDSASFELIDHREIKLWDGVETASFQANFTLSVTPAVLDTGNVILNLSLITLPPKPQPIFTELLAEDGKTYLLAEVKAKEGRSYRVYLTPRITELPEPECDLDTRDKEKEDWDELPSAHFFFRFILNSLADLHWAEIKGYAETEYRRFRETFGFTQPAMDRMEYFLLPCRANEVVWDDRFNIGLDPSKNKIYSIYNLFERSLDSPGMGFLLFYRLWGYAPPLLAEGIGNYFSLSHHFTKKLIASERWIPLNQLLITKDYRRQPEDVAFWEACSFVRFLVKTYHLDKFKLLYKRSTDLTLKQTIEEVYKKDLATLEKEWLSFLEGYRDTIADFYYLASVRMANRHYDEAIQLYEDMLDLYGRQTGILRSLAYVYYLKGDYDRSEKYYEEVLAEDTLNLEYLHILGNINSIQGEYDKARSYYLKVISLDSTYVRSYLKLAQLEIAKGDLLFAKNHFEQAQRQDTNTQSKVEIYSGLGTLYKKLGQSEEALKNFKNALFYARRFVTEFSDRPIPYLELGESFFNLGEIDSAINYLQVAEFLEDRPVYRGRVFLALGKASQKKNDLSKAKMYLQKVLSLPSGFKERKEAENLLSSM